MKPFSNFERWALSLAVPALELPPLPENATDTELWRRAVQISYDLIRDEGEKGLATILVQNGALAYLEEEVCR
jgi:hypothetical protein